MPSTSTPRRVYRNVGDRARTRAVRRPARKPYTSFPSQESIRYACHCSNVAEEVGGDVGGGAKGQYNWVLDQFYGGLCEEELHNMSAFSL